MKIRKCIGGYVHNAMICLDSDYFWVGPDLELDHEQMPNGMKYELEGEHYRCWGFSGDYFTDLEYNDVLNCLSNGEIGIQRQTEDL